MMVPGLPTLREDLARPGVILPVLLLCLLIWPVPLRADQDASALAGEEARPLAIVHGRVFPATGAAPIQDGVVLIRGDRIEAVGLPEEVSIPPRARVLDAAGGTVMPGLFNAHIHHGAFPEVRAQFLAQGVTSVCDLGAPGDEYLGYRETTYQGHPVSRGFYAGPFLAPPGGYPDGVHGTHGYNREVVGVEEAREGVREVAELGASFVKIALDPSWDRENPVPMFDLEETRAIVEEAHHLGLRVRAHMIQIPHFPLAVEGGVDIIEHLPFPTGWPPVDTIQVLMTEGDPLHYFFTEWHPQYGPLLKRMAQAGTILVPTASALVSDYFVKENPTLREQFVVVTIFDLVRRYRDLGGTIALGNDYNGRSGREMLPMTEIRALLAAGLTPFEVLEAGTRNAALSCGQEDRLGTLEPGKLADVLILEGDFFHDPEVLARPRWIILGGEVVSR